LGRIALEPANQARKVKFRLPNAGKKMEMIRHERESAEAQAIKSFIAQQRSQNVLGEDHIGKEWSAKVSDQGDCAEFIDRTVIVTE